MQVAFIVAFYGGGLCSAVDVFRLMMMIDNIMSGIKSVPHHKTLRDVDELNAMLPPEKRLEPFVWNQEG
ncbi:hypothetical protein MSG28_015327 [Choristoneura fumiferana]|uniref:Uncharacterized protein n=1 Tax=Choristoneura fumiferana TaxID=7141 RepID=A0ACC0KAE9_CHOFU|nr:hypothetical protein MSG28_015327 [Choristoneura fumiferana]